MGELELKNLQIKRFCYYPLILPSNKTIVRETNVVNSILPTISQNLNSYDIYPNVYPPLAQRADIICSKWLKIFFKNDKTICSANISITSLTHTSARFLQFRLLEVYTNLLSINCTLTVLSNFLIMIVQLFFTSLLTSGIKKW